MNIPFIRQISWFLMIAVFLLGIQPEADAGFAPSNAVKPSGPDTGIEAEKTQTVLERKKIKDKLESLGFTEEEIKIRLSQLDDQQIHEVALHVDNLRTGGSLVYLGWIFVGVIVGIILYKIGIHKLFTKSSPQPSN